MNDVVVIGSLNMDVVLEVEHFPVAGETVHARGMATGAGGKGANQAVACARLSLGSRVRMIGMVGDDEHGRALRAALTEHGVDAANVGVDAGPSGCAFVFVDPQGHNRIVVVAGANGALGPAEIDRAAACIEPGALVLMQLESPLPTVMHAAEVARARGATVVLNPSPVVDLPERLWRSVDVVVANEIEARQLTGVDVTSADQARAAALALLSRGLPAAQTDPPEVSKGPSLAVVTLGADGVVAAGSTTRGGAVEHHRVPARRVQAVDTTAAGDTFTGAFCAALAAGWPLAAALQRGVDAAAICVTRRGAMASVPYAAEVDAAAS